MTKKKKPEDLQKVGAKTKYSIELAKKIAELMTYNTIKKTCELADITPETYYQWLYRHPEFAELSTAARKTKAIKHFTECENILEEIKYTQNDEAVRSDMVRLRLDFHLRLAGKANQGLFGDTAKNNIEVTVDLKDVDVPARVSEKDWVNNVNE